ncbi:MAG: cytochrome c [Chloroflexi bacterium]|nr:cytochrome c [Chloroflexota bacterium]
MPRPFPRTRLGMFRGAWIAAEVVLLGLLIGSTGALAAIRDRWDLMNRTPESRGAQVYQVSCAGCHGGPAGGTITDQPPKHNANGHTWQHADCELMQMIRDSTTVSVSSRHPLAAPPLASAMPAFRGRLDDDDIRDVVAYIRTMWTDDQRASQRQLTRERCAG